MTLLIMMLFLAGCVVGPDYERSQLFSDSLIEKSLGIAASTEKFTGDFQNFHDDTLNNLITVGLKNNLTIRQAIAALREARYALRSEQAGLFPTLDALGQYQKIKNSKNTVLAVSSDSYQVGLDAGWEIDIFGHQQRKIEQSAAAANKAIANLKNVLVSLCAEIALTYYDLRLNQVLLEKTKENVVINQELRDITNDLYQTGLTDNINLSQADYLVQNTQANIPALEQKIVADIVSLSLLLGVLPPDTENIISIDDNPITQVIEYDINRFYRLNSEVIRMRPDVEMAEAEVVGQNAALGVAIAELYPQINLSGLFGFESLKSANLFNHASWMYELIPAVQLPVFHFGALKNNVLIQQAKKEQVVAAYEQTVLNAVGDVKTALIALNKEQKKNAYLKQAYDKITHAAKLTRSKYKAGLINYSEVLDAEERRLSAQTNWLSSNANLYKNIIAFYKSIGVFPH